MDKSCAPGTGRKACFFAWVHSPVLFEVVDFYRNDIRILRDLGYEVQLVSKPSELSWDADIYLTWWWGGGLPALAASLLRRRPNVFLGAHHYFQPGWDFRPERFSLRNFVKLLAMRLSLRLATANVFMSEEEFGIVKHLPVHNPHLVYLAVDHDLYRPAPAAERTHLLTISHLTLPNVRRKMICEIVEAFALVLREFPDESLVIVGEQLDGYPAVKQVVDRHGLGARVRFAGCLGVENGKLELLRQAKAYLQPTRYEGFGLATAEAMACETPVVVTEGGAVAEVVGDCGVYAGERTPQAIAEACLGVLRDPSRAEKLGRRARQRVVERFSYARRRDGLRRILESL